MHIEIDEEYERYKRLRSVGKNLNAKLVRRLQKRDLHRCGKDLGLLRKGTLVFEHEDELSVLMDYCIHNPTGKKSCVDLYIEQASLEPVSDEMMMLKALRDSFFSIIHVNGTENGYLCYAKDILRQRDIVLMDVGLGSTAQQGTLVAARLTRMPASDRYMTTGAPMSIRGRQAIDLVEWVLRKFIEPIESGTLSDTQANSIGKQVIRGLLRVGTDNTVLGDPEAHEETLKSGGFKG